MNMARKLLIAALLLTGLTPVAVHADESTETKPPIIVQQGNTRYIFTRQDEKFRNMLLNSKNLRIHDKRKKVDPEDYYKNYYRHHKRIRDHENERDSKRDLRRRERERERSSYNSGYTAGYFIARDRD